MTKEKQQLYKDYYVLLDDGQEVIDYKVQDLEDKRKSTWKTVYDGNVVKVLGPVPSYEELKILKDNLRTQIKEREKLERRLAQYEYTRRNPNDKER